jgi:hypothetical protein
MGGGYLVSTYKGSLYVEPSTLYKNTWINHHEYTSLNNIYKYTYHIIHNKKKIEWR